MSKSIEEKLQEEEERLGLVSRRLVDITWVIDMDSMTYVYISPSVEGLRGYKAHEIIGAKFSDHMAPGSQTRVINVLKKGLEAFKRGEEVYQTIEVEMVTKSNQTIWLELTSRFYREKNGSVRAFGVSKNIDHRKKSELEREELIKRLEEIIQERDALLKENKILMGLLPICSYCKKIRDENGKWWELEQYIQSRTAATFTHTIGPDCRESISSKLKSGS